MPFEITPLHLSGLSPGESVDLIRDLVWADASASGIPANLINMPSAITVRDGGIDGEVTGAKSDGRHGIIKMGVTRYQVKSGEFSPSTGSFIDDILLDSNKGLKSRIRSCLEKDGTLVIALTGWDDPDRTDDYTKNQFQKRLKEIDPKYHAAKIEIWRQNTIRGFLRNFPSLRLKILGIHNISFFFHDAWAKLDDMKHTMHLSDEHNNYLQRFRKLLRSNDRPTHIRVTGDPGMGKTRLVLEALKPRDLAPLVIYVRNPGQLYNESFLHGIVSDDVTQCIILIVDECDYSESADIWNVLKDKSPSIKLVTIFNEPRKVGGDTITLPPPNLLDKQIDSILDHDYGIPQNQRSKWVDFCKPSPRAAHVIGQNLQKNPDDVLRDPDTVNVWDRFIANVNSLKSPEFKQRKIILLWLSLFKRFGFEPPFDQEARFISDKINENHNISYGNFVSAIQTLKEMHILQGHTTLYITPKILHIKLWTEWWDKYGPSMMFNLSDIPVANPDTEMYASEPQNLRGWYCEMFKYARESSAARDVVQKLLDPGGILEHDDLLSTELGANFVLTLASADPATALSFLGRAIRTKNKNDLMNFEQGRRQAVQTLWKTSMQKNLFTDSAHLLLALGEAENEPFSNNASGIFTSLFSPAQGPLAPTEMPPSQRLPVIRDAICSDSKERRLLAIHACNAALQTEPSARILPLDDTLRQEADLWTPKSRQEIIDYYKSVLDILQNSLGMLKPDEKQLAVSAILDNVKGLLSIFDLTEYVIEMLQRLYDAHHVDNEPIIEQIEHLLAFDTLYVSHDTASKLKTLQKKLTGDDYHSMLKRYAGMHPKIDWFSESQKNRGEYANKGEIVRLAEQSLDADLLLPELKWLVTDSAKNGHRFGHALGLLDNALALLPCILEAQRNAGEDSNEMFLAGYFRALFERDANEWESQLDLMADDSTLYKNVIEVTRMSGTTDRAGRRISELLRKHDDLGHADLASFQYGMATRGLSEPVFAEWIDLLLDADNAAADTRDSMAAVSSLNLFYAYFMHGPEKTLPKDLTPRLLFHNDISREPPLGANLPMLEHIWTEICVRFVAQHPEERMPVVERVLERFGHDSIFGRYKAPAQRVLDEAAGMMPRDVLRAALHHVRIPMDSKASCVEMWIRRLMLESGADTAGMLADHLLEWADGDPETRAALCAKIVPATPGNFIAARKILIRYGDMDRVQSMLASGFNSESYSGSASAHYKKKRAEFERLKDRETDCTVRQWLDSYMSHLDSLIRGFEVHEEHDVI